MNDLETPRHGAAGELDAQLHAMRRKGIISVAASLGAGAGLFALIMALQLLDLFRIRGALKAVPYILIVYAVASFVLGVKLFRQRVWAAASSTAVHGLAGLTTFLWMFLTFASGFVSFAGMIVPPLAVAAAVCSGLSITPCIRTRAAQQRLRAAGLETDLV